MAAATLGSAALGAYSSSKSGGQYQPTQQAQSGSSISQLVPNDAAMPLYGYAAGNAQQLLQTNRPYYPGQTYVSPSEATQNGINMGLASQNWYNSAAQAYGGAPAYFNQAAQMAPQQAGYYQQAAGYAPQIAEQFGAAGDMYARQAQGLMGAVGDQRQQLGLINQNYGFLSNAADVANNPYLQAQLRQNADIAGTTLREQFLPAIQSGAQSVNALGSDRQGLAQGVAVGKAADSMNQANTQAMLAAYGQGLGAQGQAMAYGGQQLGNQLAPANTIGAAGNALTSRAGSTSGAMGAYDAAGNLIGNAAGAYNTAGMNKNAAGNAFGLAGQAGTTGANNFLGYGQAIEGYQNAALQDQMARFYYPYDQAWANQQNAYNSMHQFDNIGQQYGASSQNNTGQAPNPYYQSPLTGAVGGAQLGAGLYDLYKQYQPNNPSLYGGVQYTSGPTPLGRSPT